MPTRGRRHERHVLTVELGRGSECERWALEHLVEGWRERASIPGCAVVRERTSRWLGGALERLGIEVVASDRLQALEPARAELLAQI